jgi:hypothetical protein
LEQQQRPQLESQQAAAVEAEDFDAAAAIDEQLQVRLCVTIRLPCAWHVGSSACCILLMGSSGHFLTLALKTQQTLLPQMSKHPGAASRRICRNERK